ncbi:aromatic-ring-hydroxylating dioxygenase, beta subunit [Verminephrobacter eiseniae EF01-2]|uniref:Aromatic-ring-hydroxylating dioxygenase, beta subunit n=2 Tax=Verminephrobacter eiseniae TaxID=364317 RepID=A1WLK5_VEREI|nr:aromatic-ring-hydroxylating dioxygenase, beta subunit [Verminephrobacter eiseniae EF01-2]MCW5284087.1 hypothetical protein [Verminephrobacter eiseniae]MCW5301795.1 hypothetical protein [Verminephrobacter eiseniae]
MDSPASNPSGLALPGSGILCRVLSICACFRMRGDVVCKGMRQARAVSWTGRSASLTPERAPAAQLAAPLVRSCPLSSRTRPFNMNNLLNPEAVALHLDVTGFLYQEARLLDEAHYAEWLELLEPQVLVRLCSREVIDAASTPVAVPLLDENRASLEAHVYLLSQSSLSIAENPHSFTRRLVSNVMVAAGTAADSVHVRSHQLVHRICGRSTVPIVLTITRDDVLGRHDGRWRLRSREAVMNGATVGANNLTALF